MLSLDSSHLTNLVLVAGHAVYIRQNFLDPEQDRSWFLQISLVTGLQDFKARRLSPSRILRQPALLLSCSAGTS